MPIHADKTQGNTAAVSHSSDNLQSRSSENGASERSNTTPFQFTDNRQEGIAQRKLQEIANNSEQVKRANPLQAMAIAKQPQQPVIQRAIGAEVETNLDMFRHPAGGVKAPVRFPNGTVIGQIHGAQVLVDTAKEVEVATVPFNANVAGGNNLSGLGAHLNAVSNTLATNATPTRGIALGAGFTDLVFDLNPPLHGDFHINVSPHDTGSMEQLYEANTARQNAHDAAEGPRIKAAYPGIANRNIPDESSQRVLKAAFIQKWRTALQTAILAERGAGRFPVAAGEQNLRTLLTRIISDVAIGLNTRKMSGGNSSKNNMELMPKVNIQQVLDQWGAIHTGGNVPARAMLMQSFITAMGQAKWDFIWHNWKAGIQNNVNLVRRDAHQMIVERRPIIRDRRTGNDMTNSWKPEADLRRENPNDGGKAAHYLEGVIRPTTSNLVDRGPAAPVGVYEDRRPFVHVGSPSVGHAQWQQSITDYERELQQHRVTYMNAQTPVGPAPQPQNNLVRNGLIVGGLAVAGYGAYALAKWALS